MKIKNSIKKIYRKQRGTPGGIKDRKILIKADCDDLGFLFRLATQWNMQLKIQGNLICGYITLDVMKKTSFKNGVDPKANYEDKQIMDRIGKSGRAEVTNDNYSSSEILYTPEAELNDLQSYY